ncbi:GNAT family N-acetyltransferase [Nocardioides sp. Root190]|uniref:GNAT family N-acetyltransferase n=1 Tax=Nocardioides sp. Root190 TaxID=1736488 RepID=UPI00138EEAF0|nr:GNAT family N-acetyltransferase [Nocardioides sp. Root190]
MELHPFGPDDVAALETWSAVTNAVSAADAPWNRRQTPALGAGRFRHGWDEEPDTPYLAVVEGRAVGWCAIGTSEYDNLDLAWLRVEVLPHERRKGHGTAMIEQLLSEVARLGRTSVGCEAWESAAADAFASRHGFERKLSSINRRQVLADVDWPRLDERYDAALPFARDYVLERWPVPTPEERLDALAEMASAINDAPIGDLDYEDEVFDATRMRAYETAMAGRGEQIHRIVARHRPSDDLAAQTVVTTTSADPTWGDQHDTSVVRAHRGHRLGLLLKVEMLRWLREAAPDLTTIDTWNAESNDHMIGVNEVLGYQVLGREWAYQRSLGDAQE